MGGGGSAVPKRGRSKRGRTQKHVNARKRAQMSAAQNVRKRARKRAQERALLRKNCKQPGFRETRMGVFQEGGSRNS